MKKAGFSVVFWLYLLHCCWALSFDLTPRYYRQDDKVDLLVNKIESDSTQLPFSYQELSFVCPQEKALHLSLGEILRGDRLWLSKYDLRFGVDVPCKLLCDVIAKEESTIKKADSLVRSGYVVHWTVDGLPGATTFFSRYRKNKYYASGFPLGFVKDGTSYLYNHVTMVVMYRKEEQEGLHSIVGFEVYPKSVNSHICPDNKKYENFPLESSDAKSSSKNFEKRTIPYTYSVYWRQDNSIDYQSRWDLYYENDTLANKQIHWFAIMNSLILVGLLSLVVAIVLLRVLKSDIQSHNTILPSNEMEKSAASSWRGLSGEVIKMPRLPLLLSLLVAGGIQLITATIGVIFTIAIANKFNFTALIHTFALFNNQGAVLSICLTFFVLSGVIPSYVGTILHKLFNNVYLNSEYGARKVIALSILYGGFLPATVLLIMLFLNFFVWAKEASTALPFGTILVLLSIFFAVILPLGMIGGYYGNKFKFDRKSFLLTSQSHDGTDNGKGTKPSMSPSRRVWLLSPIQSVLVFGLIPFIIIYVELLFIFNSVWLEKTTSYYMYGFLLATSLILIIIISESTIIATYISLAVYNNPNWHWLCFWVGSSLGWYIFGYTIYYFLMYLNIRDLVSTLLYFSYMALACGLISIACGSVGVLTGLLFIKRIYSSVKLD